MLDRLRRLLKLKKNVEHKRDTGLMHQNKRDDEFIPALMYPTSTVGMADRNVKPLETPNTQRTSLGVKKRVTRLIERLSTFRDANNMTRDNINQWHISFDSLLSDKYGVSVFRRFLKSEFSEENIDFWILCDHFKQTKNQSKLKRQAYKICKEYIVERSPKQINIESGTRSEIESKLASPTPDMFDKAQKRVQLLMENGSYKRFLESDVYKTTQNDINMG